MIKCEQSFKFVSLNRTKDGSAILFLERKPLITI
nr:MAG TPA: hypothetical protein [Caudoviricetes sp.]